jgi:branched-chain amino acid transport system substrate-binding protein
MQARVGTLGGWLGLACACLGAGCGDDVGAEPGNVIRIGVFLGEGAEGDDQLLAVREINRGGGLTIGGVDYTIDLVRELQGDTAATGVAALERMIDEGIVAAEGPRWSSITLGEADDHSDGVALTAAANNVMIVSGTASSAAITGLDDDALMWRTMPSDAFQGVAGANHAFEALGARRAAILLRDDIWGRGLAETFRTQFESLGGQVLTSVAYDTDEDLDSYAFPELDMVFADQPDVIYVLAFTELSQISNRVVQGQYLDAYGASPPHFFSGDGAFNSELSINAAPAVLDLLVGTVPAPAPDDPILVRFLDAYEEEGFGDRRLAWPYTYDAIYLMALAIQSAQSLDAQVFKGHMQQVSRDEGGDTQVQAGNWADAKAALLAGEGIDFVGASGPIDFTDQGDPSRGRYALWRAVSDGTGGYNFDSSQGIEYQVE